MCKLKMKKKIKQQIENKNNILEIHWKLLEVWRLETAIQFEIHQLQLL